MSVTSRQREAIRNLVEEYKEATSELEAIQATIDKLKERLMTKLQDAELETITVGEGEEVKVTIVRPTTLKIDEEGLKEALSPSLWKSVTKQVIDKKALEDAVVRGKIEASVVADNSKEVAAKPYLRITG